MGLIEGAINQHDGIVRIKVQAGVQATTSKKPNCHFGTQWALELINLKLHPNLNTDPTY